LLLFVASAAMAQDFDLSWHTVDGGGVTVSKGGDFEIGATVGQVDAGALTGGDFTLAGGFWPGAAGGTVCTGNERINKAKCKRGTNELTVKLRNGVPGDGFVIVLSSGQRKEGDLNGKGRGTARFTNVPPGPGTARATFGCGAVNERTYRCR